MKQIVDKDKQEDTSCLPQERKVEQKIRDSLIKKLMELDPDLFPQSTWRSKKLRQRRLPIYKLRVPQYYDKKGNGTDIKHLDNSYLNHGEVKPIIVNKVGNHYSVIDGVARLRVLEQQGKKIITCIILEVSPEIEKEIYLELERHYTTMLLDEIDSFDSGLDSEIAKELPKKPTGLIKTKSIKSNPEQHEILCELIQSAASICGRKKDYDIIVYALEKLIENDTEN